MPPMAPLSSSERPAVSSRATPSSQTTVNSWEVYVSLPPYPFLDSRLTRVVTQINMVDFWPWAGSFVNVSVKSNTIISNASVRPPLPRLSPSLLTSITCR